MASPRIFVSSTYYDLKRERESVKNLIEGLGYTCVLSEDGVVFYNPGVHVHTSCIDEVRNCNMLVLIIGGRYGSEYVASKKSITAKEYEEAVKSHIPVFALVDEAVNHAYNSYLINKNKPFINEISFLQVEDVRVFHFIDEIRERLVNNAIQPFNSITDIGNYLKSQWAGMLHKYLESTIKYERESDVVKRLAYSNQYLTLLIRQILSTVGSDIAKLIAFYYDEYLRSGFYQDLRYWNADPLVSPASIVTNETFEACAKSLGVKIRIIDEADEWVSWNGEISRSRYRINSSEYEKMHTNILSKLNDMGIDQDQFIAEANMLSVV